MSYPYDSPSYDMATIWQSGSYTPNTVVRNIRDNYTPINKNSMRNSVGAEISSVQNFVNSKYLGRPTIPVESGFFNSVLIGTGMVYNDDSYYTFNNIGKAYFKCPGVNSGLIYTGDNGFINRIKSLDNILVISTNGQAELTFHEFTNKITTNAGVFVDNLQIGGFEGTLNPGEMIANSGMFYADLQVVGSGMFGFGVVGSGTSYVEPAYLPFAGPRPAVLTVGYQGDTIGAYIKTQKGALILNGGYYGQDLDYLESKSAELHLICGNSSITVPASGTIALPVNATDPTTSYALVNAIKAVLIQRGWAS